MNIQLPLPSQEALLHSKKVKEHILEKIAASTRKAISFADYMQEALYAPGLGYYAVGNIKFGKEGDFITSPEISPLFGHCVANQCERVLSTIPGSDILELGAGSGRLAQSILERLEALGTIPAHYYILEVSPDLQQRQKNLLKKNLFPSLFERCIWLDALPKSFHGIIIANEVLDALSTHRYSWSRHGFNEIFVTEVSKEFGEIEVPTPADITQTLEKLHKKYGKEWPQPYVFEVNWNANYLVHTLSHILCEGMILFIDYGFPAVEFYHPSRNQGTLVCHYRHHVHADPYYYPGLQDITAHVDFTAIAHEAIQCGLDLAGFTTQAGFLLGSGLTEISMPEDVAAQLALSQQIQMLTSMAEMGELFKVIAFTKACPVPLLHVDFLARRCIDF